MSLYRIWSFTLWGRVNFELFQVLVTLTGDLKNFERKKLWTENPKNFAFHSFSGPLYDLRSSKANSLGYFAFMRLIRIYIVWCQSEKERMICQIIHRLGFDRENRTNTFWTGPLVFLQKKNTWNWINQRIFRLGSKIRLSKTFVKFFAFKMHDSTLNIDQYSYRNSMQQKCILPAKYELWKSILSNLWYNQ